MSSIVDKGHRDAARRMRDLVAVFESKRDLVLLGAYAKGTDKELDRAIDLMPQIEAFLRQGHDEVVAFSDAVKQLTASTAGAMK
jgi:flagellar biosynthesis/type III secretory pathway ATPase